VDLVLEPARSYRLVARVTEERPTPVTAPLSSGGVTVRGGFSFRDATSCGGKKIVSIRPEPTATSLAIRFAPVPFDARPDPVDASLRVSRATLSNPVLTWQDVSAPGYRVLRCATRQGPCVPAAYADATGNAYTDPGAAPLPGESIWYVVKAVNACKAGS